MAQDLLKDGENIENSTIKFTKDKDIELYKIKNKNVKSSNRLADLVRKMGYGMPRLKIVFSTMFTVDKIKIL